MDDRITAAVAILEQARAALATAVEAARADCGHAVIYETPWVSLGTGRDELHARRICEHCRLEEEGSHWSEGISWTAETGETILGNQPGRAILKLDRDVLYKKRLPK